MDTPRYLPATFVKAGDLSLGRLSVRTRDNREIGTLAGFVIDARRIISLVIDADDSRLELPMGAIQFDPLAQSLRMQDDGAAHGRAFSSDSAPQIDVADLWVPVYHSAA